MRKFDIKDPTFLHQKSFENICKKKKKVPVSILYDHATPYFLGQIRMSQICFLKSPVSDFFFDFSPPNDPK